MYQMMKPCSKVIAIVFGVNILNSLRLENILWKTSIKNTGQK